MQTSNDEQLLQEIKETNRLLKKSVSRKQSLVRGIWVGLGTVIGGTILIAIIVWILSWLKIIPVIGTPAAEILKYVELKYDIPDKTDTAE